MVTQPHIGHAVHIVSQFVSAPRSTQGHFISNADWVCDPTDCHSMTGYCFIFGDSLISCRSKKQALVSCSSTLAEYRALADMTQGLLCLRWLLADMCVVHSTCTMLCYDNLCAIQIAHNNVFHGHINHIVIELSAKIATDLHACISSWRHINRTDTNKTSMS